MSAGDVDFVVYGRAYPKGSKTVTPNGAMMDAHPSRCKDDEERKRRNRERRAWPDLVQHVAERWARTKALDVLSKLFAFNVCAVFYLPHPKNGRQRDWHVSTPDLDKLLRGICDPLTRAGVWHDDAQVVSFNGSAKKYAKKGAPVGHPDGPRVEITVRPVVD